METDELIARLAKELTPVKPAPSPAICLLRWLVITVPALALVVWVVGPRPDLAYLLARPNFATAELLALGTALISAYAAFCAGRPDQPGWKLWLPVVAMTLWLAELGRQCFVLSLRTGGAALALRPDLMCVPAIAISGLAPAVAMVWFLRRSAMFRTTHACLCGALAAAAAAEAALRLFHAEDTMMMVLVWQMGSVVLFTAFGGAVGRVMMPGRRHRLV